MSRRKSAQRRAAARSADPEGDAAFEAAMLERWPRPEPVALALRVASLAAVFGLMAWAIAYRGATAGALLLPMAGEIVAGFVVALVLALVVVREAKFRRETLSSLTFWGVVFAGWLAWTGFEANRAHVPLDRHLAQTFGAAVDYVRVYGMHWPMLAAAIGLVVGTAGDVTAYRRKGPPFVFLGSLNLGLRMFVLMIAGMGFLVTIDWSRRERAYLMLLVLAAGEAFALWAPFLVQKKIREQRAEPGRKTATASAVRREAP